MVGGFSSGQGVTVNISIW